MAWTRGSKATPNWSKSSKSSGTWTSDTKPSSVFSRGRKDLNGGWFFSWFLAGWFEPYFERASKASEGWSRL